MPEYKMVQDKLNELEIEYEVISHEPAVTIEHADKFIEGMEGVRTKTMFLTDKKKTVFFLFIMEDGKRLDMELFAELANVKRVKIASPETLYNKMMLEPGVVSPFGLMNNSEKDIKVYIDKAIISEKRMCFHPNTNEKTLFLDTVDIIKFIENIGYEVKIVEI